LRDELRLRRLLPTADRQWASLADDVYLNDDSEQADAFRGQSGVHLVLLEGAHDSAAAVAARVEMLASCGVPRLSEVSWFRVFWAVVTFYLE
jgi:hypothetical protein